MKTKMIAALLLSCASMLPLNSADDDVRNLPHVLAKGGCVLVGGGWALERLKNSYRDIVRDTEQAATMQEDMHNVAASVLCTAMLAYAGGGSRQMIGNILGSGAVLGGAYLGAKHTLKGARDLRLREFVAIIAACAVGREVFRKLGVPVFKLNS